jgi:hypothetical protein
MLVSLFKFPTGLCQGSLFLLETLLRPCHCNTLSLIVTAMFSDNLTRDTEPSDNLIEYEEGCSLPIRFNCSHGLGPLINLVDDHDNVLIPPI